MFRRAEIGQLALLLTTGTYNETLCSWQLQTITLSSVERGGGSPGFKVEKLADLSKKDPLGEIGMRFKILKVENC